MKRAVVAYLSIGLLLSGAENIWALCTGGPTAFVWTGSVQDNAVLLFYWFLLPALTWPIDVYWTLYHTLG